MKTKRKTTSTKLFICLAIASSHGTTTPIIGRTAKYLLGIIGAIEITHICSPSDAMQLLQRAFSKNDAEANAGDIYFKELKSIIDKYAHGEIKTASEAKTQSEKIKNNLKENLSPGDIVNGKLLLQLGLLSGFILKLSEKAPRITKQNNNN